FALSFALTIASVLILLLGLTETKAPTLRGGGKGLLDLGILGILRGNRDLLIVFISYFFYIGAMSCRLPFFAIYVSEELGLSYVELGFIVGAGGLLALFSRVSSGLLADRLGGKRVLVVAGLVRASAFLLIPFARDLVHLVGVYLLFSIFMCGPPRNALISKITRASTRGEVFGAIGAFGDVARTLIPIPIGLIAQNLSLRASFGTLATLTIAYVAIVSLIREPREPR
ncbi:TPA: MFS transporter, partial [Candidatus Bathyarchaeota archaeon]|nr:MFS transporter [Candidatus Bathyarchaeota archaeon]